MFSSDLEKGAGAHASSNSDQNTSSRPVSTDFPPKYESQVNYEMQRLGEAQPQGPKIVDIDYDTLAPSQRKQSKRPMWLWAIIASAVIAMIIGAVIIAVHVVNQKRTEEVQSPVVTRSEPSASMASMTMSPEPTTVTVQPLTSVVYITVSPPAPSTTTVVVMPSEPTSFSTPIVTVTSTLVASTSTSVSTSTETVTSTLVASSSTSSATTAPVTTVVSSAAPDVADPEPASTSEPSTETTKRSGPLLGLPITSVMSEIASSSETEAPSPTTETVVSITTDTATETASEERIPVVSTADPVLFRCSTPGMSCGK